MNRYNIHISSTYLKYSKNCVKGRVVFLTRLLLQLVSLLFVWSVGFVWLVLCCSPRLPFPFFIKKYVTADFIHMRSLLFPSTLSLSFRQ